MGVTGWYGISHFNVQNIALKSCCCCHHTQKSTTFIRMMSECYLVPYLFCHVSYSISCWRMFIYDIRRDRDIILSASSTWNVNVQGGNFQKNRWWGSIGERSRPPPPTAHSASCSQASGLQIRTRTCRPGMKRLIFTINRLI